MPENKKLHGQLATLETQMAAVLQEIDRLRAARTGQQVQILDLIAQVAALQKVSAR
jgi:hypothetical protein